MKTKGLLAVMVLGLNIGDFAQKVAIDFTFTAIDSAAYVQLDSIKVMNRTQDSDTTLYWPDTTLTYETIPGDTLLYIGYSTEFPVGIQDIHQNTKNFQVFQNYPNPVKDQCIISMYIPDNGTVNVMVADMLGRVIITSDWSLDQGNHSFRFIPGGRNLYFLTARFNGISRTIKILKTESNAGMRCMLDYIGIDMVSHSLKAVSPNTGFMEESGILDSPVTGETYTFQFATNIPCPGTPTVNYEGQVYNTIQIFSQCWLKENLNAGTMVNVNLDQTNNNIIEKYCNNNKLDSCTKYGGLYQWNEMMQYTTQQGAQGICPPGWHLPTDEEWKVLEGAVDSDFGIGDPEWDICWDWRGRDAGKNLKTTSGWLEGGNGTDLFDFSGLPGGNGYQGFYNVGSVGYWWTSSMCVDYNAYARFISRYPGADRMIAYKILGYSVRCLRD